MVRHLNHLRDAFWNSFENGVFMTSKGAAYSMILTVFPAFIVLAWILAQTHTTHTFLAEIEFALGKVLPPGTRGAALAYFEGQKRPLREIYSATSVMILAASGVTISWMNGFRRAYGIGVNSWGFWHERAVALFLVLLGFAPMLFAMVLVAFGNLIENWMVLNREWVPRFYILVLFSFTRWLIAFITSVTVIMLIYHWGLPRIQPWHRVVPGAILATFIWFPLTIGFGWYVTNLANYNQIYGSLGAAIALLVWLYLVSIAILIGAEYNALICPREPMRDGKDERRRVDRRQGPRRDAEQTS